MVPIDPHGAFRKVQKFLAQNILNTFGIWKGLHFGKNVLRLVPTLKIFKEMSSNKGGSGKK